MNRLIKKLKNQNGASILLALLFFLLCSMVGSSILIASVSNAGKRNSNEEQQRIYLELSSAVKLVCDDITSCEYKGVYSYDEQETGEGDDKTVTKTFKQLTGSYTKIGTANNGAMSSILVGKLDSILSKEINSSHNNGTGYKTFTTEPQFSETTNTVRTYTVKKENAYTTALSNPDSMKIEIKVDKDYGITVWATYNNGTEADPDIYTICAKLAPANQPITLATFEKGPNNKTTKSMKWKLNSIDME